MFGAGRYSPATTSGRRLLAHELAHSIQQGFAPNPLPRRVDDQRGALEGQAVESAEGVIESASPPSPGIDIPIAPARPATSLQRQGDIKIPFSSSTREETGTRTSSGAQETEPPALRLNDYNDRNPLHDPSKLSDAHIESTNEFKSYMASDLRWQWQYHMTKTEALLACRLILRRLREGSHVNFKMEAADFMMRARRQLGTLLEAEKLVGKLEHVHIGSADPDDPHPDLRDPKTSRSDFFRWMLAGGPEPTNASTMNCWEMVLFGAFRGGFMSKAKIKNMYEMTLAKYRLQFERTGDRQTPIAVLENELCDGYSRILELPISPEPLPGDIISLDHFETHVAISLGTKTPGGGHQVISLHEGKVERVTIEDLIRWFGNSGYYIEAVNLCQDPWRGK